MFPGLPNPMQIMSMMVKGKNPKSAIVNSLRQSGNEAGINLANMIENNDEAGIEQLARNAGKEKGINVDELKNNFEKQFFGMFRR